MSNYYLDLEQTGTAHTGTEIDAWSYADYLDARELILQKRRYCFCD